MHEQIREAELLQALDRVRAIFNHRTVYLLNNLVLDVTHDDNVSWRDMKAGGNRLEAAFEQTGKTVWLTTPGELSRCFDDIWKTKDAAKKTLSRTGGDKLPIVFKDSPYHKLLASCPPLLITYQRPGERQQPCAAWVYAPASSAWSELEKVVGPVLDNWSIDWAATVSRQALPQIPAPLDGNEGEDGETMIEVRQDAMTPGVEIFPYQEEAADIEPDVGDPVIAAIADHRAALEEVTGPLDRFEAASSAPDGSNAPTASLGPVAAPSQASAPAAAVEPAVEAVEVHAERAEEVLTPVDHGDAKEIPAPSRRIIGNFNFPSPISRPAPPPLPADLADSEIVWEGGVEIGRLDRNGDFVPVQQYPFYDLFWGIRYIGSINQSNSSVGGGYSNNIRGFTSKG